MQHVPEILLGEQGLGGVQALLVGSPAQEMLRTVLEGMLLEGCRLGACSLQRAKFKPARKLVAYYDLAVHTAAGPTAAGEDSFSRCIAVTWSRGVAPQVAAPANAGAAFPFARLAAAVQGGVEGDPWHLQVLVSPHDAAYPQLPRLVDPAYVRTLLGAYGAPAAAYTVSTVRYRPGQRHVLRYSPAGDGQAVDGAAGGPGALFAKLYAPAQYPPARGQAFSALTHRLADWLETCVPGATVLRPAAYVAEDTVTLYPWVPGVPLANLQGCRGEPHSELAQALAATGAALAALHAAPPAVTGELAQLGLTGEIAAVAKTCEHIQVLLPAAGRTIEALLARIAGAYAALPQEAGGFIHGDFKADHVLVTPTGQLTLIDFDSCGLGDPAYDIGKFLADLAWAYAACPPDDLQAAQAAFLRGYGLPAGHPRLQRAQVVAALILLKIAAHRVKLFDPSWADQTRALVMRAQALLE